MNRHDPAWWPDDVSEDAVHALDVPLDRVWNGVQAGIWNAPHSPVERRLASILRSDALARTLVTTPSLVLAWLLSSIAVFALGMLVSITQDFPLLPLIAPGIGAVAVAFAYGAGADPAYEIARTMPVPARLILLVRVCAVLITNTAIGLLAMLFLPSVGAITVLWLIPMLAISLLALAVTIAFHQPVLGAVVALMVWCTVIWNEVIRNETARLLVEPAGVEQWMPLYLALIVVSLAAIWWMSGDSDRRRELAGWL